MLDGYASGSNCPKRQRSREAMADERPANAASVAAAKIAAAHEREEVYRQSGGKVYIEEDGTVWLLDRDKLPVKVKP